MCNHDENNRDLTRRFKRYFHNKLKKSSRYIKVLFWQKGNMGRQHIKHLILKPQTKNQGMASKGGQGREVWWLCQTTFGETIKYLCMVRGVGRFKVWVMPECFYFIFFNFFSKSRSGFGGTHNEKRGEICAFISESWNLLNDFCCLMFFWALVPTKPHEKSPILRQS